MLRLQRTPILTSKSALFFAKMQKIMTNRNVQKSQENTTSKDFMRTASQNSQKKFSLKTSSRSSIDVLLLKGKKYYFWCFLVFDQKKIWPLSLEGQSAYFEIWRGQNILISYEINDWTLTLVCHNSKPWLSKAREKEQYFGFFLFFKKQHQVSFHEPLRRSFFLLKLLHFNFIIVA